MKVLGFMLVSFLLAVSIFATVRAASGYAPQAGEHFNYLQTITVDNGQGSYSGYTDQSTVTGAEHMDSVTGDLVSASFQTSYHYYNNQGNSSSGTASGDYTWSSGNLTYVNGTDDQVGYSSPTYVWFFMDASLPVGGTFYLLNTQFAVMDRNYSYQMPAEVGRYVQTIHARGTGQYQRSDDYGVFAASYTWDEYFDPSTGYIVGYKYVEQDSGQYQGDAGSFTYTDTLYVTSTSYPLAAASAPPATGSGGLDLFIVIPIAMLVLFLVVVIAAAVVARNNRRKHPLPEHSPTPPSLTPPPPTPWDSKINIGSKPPEQVVIREVPMVTCRYCRTLYPATADRCPYCGGPRQ